MESASRRRSQPSKDYSDSHTSSIVQNAGQVNIASDGGQQVNVQKSKQSNGRAKKKTGNAGRDETNGKRGNKTKSKQLAPKSAEESIKMKADSDAVLLQPKAS